MDRRGFLRFASIGGAISVLPNALAGCASDASAMAPTAPTGATLAAPAAGVRRFSDAFGHVFDVSSGLSSGGGQVQVLSAQGAVLAMVAPPLAFPVAAVGISATTWLLLDAATSSLSAYDLSGDRIGDFGPGTSLNRPRDLAVNASTVAVADTLGHRVVVVDLASGTSRSIGVGTLNGPSSVAFAADGSIVVAELGSADVRRFALDGTLLATAGGFGGDAGQFLRPRCVRFDASGLLHIADLLGGYVSIFDASLTFQSRVAPTLASGAPAAPRWISTGPDGSLHYDLIPASAS